MPYLRVPPARCATTPTPRALLVLLSLAAFSPAGVASRAHAQAGQRIGGVVVEDSTLRPVALAEVWLLDDDYLRRVLNTRTDSAGRFLLNVRSPGRYAVRARRLGYAPIETQLYTLASGQELLLQIRMVRQAQVLPEVATTADERSFMFEGFDHRRQNGFGEYFTREDLVRRGEPRLVDLIRQVAGVNVLSTSGRQSAMSQRTTSMTRCQMVVFVDGVRMNKSDDHPDVLRRTLEGLPGNVIEGVEIYKGRSQLPAEFGGPEVRCGAVVVWTRAGGRPAPGRE
ncbi:MAG: carboxypeptidase regulatory-like domain-containing protein [Gemmatimonadaceae bacterium]